MSTGGAEWQRLAAGGEAAFDERSRRLDPRNESRLGSPQFGLHLCLFAVERPGVGVTISVRDRGEAEGSGWVLSGHC